jgi:hypothetical protein
MKIVKFKEKDEEKKENIKITEELAKFVDTFNLLTIINVGDKIGKYNNKYYIEETGRLQKFKRWWNGESRSKTFTYLDEDFTNFFKFCNKIKNEISSQAINFTTYKTDLLKLITEIIPGLYNLKQTYEEEKDDDSNKLKCKIDSIILTIIDFKEELSNIRTTSEPKGIQLFVPPEQPTSSLCCLQSCSI